MKEFKGSQSYVASEELLRAANIAMVLEKPLLIKGEPGTGKTMLAEAISQALPGVKLYINTSDNGVEMLMPLESFTGEETGSSRTTSVPQTPAESEEDAQ